MNRFRFVFAVAVLALISFVLVPGESANAATKKPVPEKPVERGKVIKSVDLKAGTVVILFKHDNLPKTYKIDFVTKLTLNNVEGKITDIKPGMVVDDLSERDFDTLDSLTLSGYGLPPATPATKAPPKKK